MSIFELNDPADESVSTRLIRAGLLTALIDGTFSGVLSAFFYNSTVARLFQGVASTLMGPRALEGGLHTAMIGVLMHVGVAFGWSTVFLLLADRLGFVQNVLRSPNGILKVAAVYGPIIWMVMSFIVIPTLRHVPITINYRWWIQFFGHIPFVGLPIVWPIGRKYRGALAS
jgi:hypothetical protein